MTLHPNARHGAEALSRQVKRDVMPIEKPERRKPASRKPLRPVSERRAAAGETGGLRRTELARISDRRREQRPKASTTLDRRAPLGHCTPEQKARVRDLACIVCAKHAGDCHPAHVFDAGAVSDEAARDVRAVVPLCFEHHRAYDGERLDLSPYLEPAWRDAVAWAVEAVGLFRALRRITGKRWAPVEAESVSEETIT